MTYSDRFVKLAREQSEFRIFDENNKAFFFKRPSGDGEYIYKISDYSNDPLYYFDPDLKAELVCIRIKDRLYILDLYGCGFRFAEELPEGVYDFSSVIVKMNQKVTDEILPKYFASLDLSEQMEDEETIEYARTIAIETLLSKNPTLKTLNVNSEFFNACDVAQILCGVKCFDNLALGRLRAEEEKWVKKVSIQKKIQEFMEQDGIVSDTQLRIADALRSVDAKFVTVEFTSHGNTATGKMAPDTIYLHLKKEARFMDYVFATNKEGAEVFRALGVKGYSDNPGETLTWRNITRITYKGKTLYQA